MLGLLTESLIKVARQFLKKHILYFDTKEDRYELIPISERMKSYKVAISFRIWRGL